MVPTEPDVADLFLEPTIILGMDGTIHRLNKAARRAFRGMGPSDNFGAQLTDPGVLAPLLLRFSRVAEPSFATLTLGVDSPKPYRVTGARISGPNEPVRIGMRFDEAGAREFSVLSQRVKALNNEVHQNRVARLRLEESLSANMILYRELQHRVKNHLQMVIGMVAITRRKTKTDDERALIKGFEQRLGAIAEVQRLMYDFQNTSGVPADKLVGAIAETFKEIAGPGAIVDVRSTAVELSNEVAPTVALILNELLSNSAKYGCRDNICTVEVALEFKDRRFELLVRDHGIGFPQEFGGTGTGYNLIRGFCRQIGATLDVYSDRGAWCRISFTDNARNKEAAH